MSKKNTGLFVALGAIAGAAAAGLTYYLKYKSFNKDIEDDFHEYEDDEDMDGVDSDLSSCDSANRTYITLNKSCECTEEAVEEPAETCATATVKEDTEGAV